MQGELYVRESDELGQRVHAVVQLFPKFEARCTCWSLMVVMPRVATIHVSHMPQQAFPRHCSPAFLATSSSKSLTIIMIQKRTPICHLSSISSQDLSRPPRARQDRVHHPRRADKRAPNRFPHFPARGPGGLLEGERCEHPPDGPI